MNMQDSKRPCRSTPRICIANRRGCSLQVNETAVHINEGLNTIILELWSAGKDSLKKLAASWSIPCVILGLSSTNCVSNRIFSLNTTSRRDVNDGPVRSLSSSS